MRFLSLLPSFPATQNSKETAHVLELEGAFLFEGWRGRCKSSDCGGVDDACTSFRAACVGNGREPETFIHAHREKRRQSCESIKNKKTLDVLIFNVELI